MTLVTEDGNQIACHRRVLAEESCYFRTMFNSDFVEKEQRCITIKDVDGFVLKMLIDLAYGYPFEISNEDYIVNLLEASTMLQFLSIQDRCTELLLHRINVSNVVKLFTLADMFGLLMLRKQSFAYILYNFNQIFELKDSFLQLSKNLLLAIVAHPNLNCDNDLKIAEIANHWITENCSIMSIDNQFKIFSSIHFNSLSDSDLESIASLQFVKESKDLSDIVEYFQLSEDVRSFNVKPCSCHCHNNSTEMACRNSLCSRCLKCLPEIQKRAKLSLDKATLCCNLTPPSCLSCWNNQNVEEEPRKEESQLFCFAPEVLRLAKELLEKAPRSTPLVPCIVGHLRHSDGGDTNPTKKTKQATGPSLLIFNLESNSFQKLVTLSKVHEGPIEASGYKVCSIGRDVYIFGGEYLFGYGDWQTSVWRWDSFRNLWHMETKLPAPRRHHSICVLNDHIFLIGGYGKHRIILDNVDRYDPVNCSWKKCAPLPAAGYSSACCSYKGIIYVFSHQIYMYDPVRDKWSTSANISPRSETFSQALSVPNDGIYLTSVFSNVLYHIRPESSLQPEAVGEFQTTPRLSCYLETIGCVLTFTTVAELGSSDEKTHQIERFDLKKRSFSVVWKEACGSSSILDFGHNLGCFPYIFYE